MRNAPMDIEVTPVDWMHLEWFRPGWRNWQTLGT
jgi:hypothetical protein